MVALVERLSCIVQAEDTAADTLQKLCGCVLKAKAFDVALAGSIHMLNPHVSGLVARFLVVPATKTVPRDAMGHLFEENTYEQYTRTNIILTKRI